MPSPFTLLDLPVLPPDRDEAVATNVITTAYVQERNAIQTVADLSAFIERWHAMWKLDPEHPVKMPQATEDVLARLKNLESIQPEDRDALNVMLPPAALRAVLFAKRYHCDLDIGFVRLYLDPYPEHEEACRGGRNCRPNT